MKNKDIKNMFLKEDEKLNIEMSQKLFETPIQPKPAIKVAPKQKQVANKRWAFRRSFPDRYDGRTYSRCSSPWAASKQGRCRTACCCTKQERFCWDLPVAEEVLRSKSGTFRYVLS